MAEESIDTDRMQYIEQWGELFEQLGATRIMGRILGWLLICNPPHQTGREFADAIGMSIASISTATRTLAQAAMIERIRIRGKRSTHFRIRPGMWTQLLKKRLAHTATMRELAQEGLTLLPSSGEESSLRLREIHSYCTFIERELSALVARWEEQWRKERS